MGILLFVAEPTFASEGGIPADNLRRVSFLPQWLPQAQFAGYYVAYEKGFYRNHGLDVSILRGGPEKPSTEWLKKGAADFASMFLSTGILERARGVRLVNIGQIVRKSSQLLVVRKSSGISTWQDMDGMRVGLWGAELSILPTALFRKFGLEVRVIPQASTINLFLRGGVNVVSAMWYNEYHSILSAGVDPEEILVFHLSDYGMTFPEDGIYCLESTLRNDPQMSCSFVLASIEGWRYAFAHREEALDIVMKYVDQAQMATNRGHQRWMLDRLRDIMEPSDVACSLGELDQDDYTAVARELKAGEMLDSIPSYSDFYTNCVSSHAK